MPAEARKIHVIEEVLKVQSEAVLIEIESILKKTNSPQKSAELNPKIKPSDFAGCISADAAKDLINKIEQSRDEDKILSFTNTN